MSEDSGDKTEAPTPRRRAEAREQGNIARSQDLSAAILLLATLLLLNSLGPRIVTVLRSLVAEMLGSESLGDFSESGATGAAFRSFTSLGTAMLPLLGAVAVVAILVNVAQVGLQLSPQRLAPNLAALNPVRGLGKIFGGGNGAVKLLLDFLKVLLLGAVAYSAIHSRLPIIVSVQQLSFVQIFMLGADVVYSIGMRIGLTLLILALIDYSWQRYRIERDLKMSKQEVKEEMRRMDGDPKVKQRRRQIAVQQASKRLQKDVPTADVVVTNPTEFAVALKYDADAMGAPRVIAKGRGLLAARIREIAIGAGVPILERPPLARALYKLVEVGHEIPEQFYSAVAEILTYVYELSGKLKHRKRVAVGAGVGG